MGEWLILASLLLGIPNINNGAASCLLHVIKSADMALGALVSF